MCVIALVGKCSIISLGFLVIGSKRVSIGPYPSRNDLQSVSFFKKKVTGALLFIKIESKDTI
jgi:hypothetical protein